MEKAYKSRPLIAIMERNGRQESYQLQDWIQTIFPRKYSRLLVPGDQNQKERFLDLDDSKKESENNQQKKMIIIHVRKFALPYFFPSKQYY